MSTYFETHPQRVAQYGRVRRNGAKPSGVCLLHTAENAPDLIGPDDGAENVAAWLTRRTDHGSYHDLVDSDSIVRLAPYSAETWHDTGTNNHSYGVSAAVRAHEWHKLTPERRAAVVRNMAQAAAGYATWLRSSSGIVVPARRITRAESRAKVPGFLGHGDSDPGRRSDPGPAFDWDLFLSHYAAVMGGAPVRPTPSLPAPASGLLAVDGWLGPATIREWQADVGTTVDGVISTGPGGSQLVRRVQEILRDAGCRGYDGRAIVVDGFGIRSNVKGKTPRTHTTHALQQYLGSQARDGYLSAPSDGVRDLQRRLNAGNFRR